MLLSKFIPFNPRLLPLFSNVFRDARSFCSTTSSEGGITGKVSQTENKVIEKEQKETSNTDAPKEEIIEGNYSFETIHPYGEYNHKEKWITFYLSTTDGKKYKLRGYAGWGLMDAIRRNRLDRLFDSNHVHYCDSNYLAYCGDCHVRLDRDFYKSLPEMDEKECKQVEFLHDFFPGSSRLGCKIELQKCHDGAVIKIPTIYVVDDEDDYWAYP